jgi:hypothetical protein
LLEIAGETFEEQRGKESVMSHVTRAAIWRFFITFA